MLIPKHVGEFLFKTWITNPDIPGPLFESQNELVKALEGLPPELFSYSDVKSYVSKLALGKISLTPRYRPAIEAIIRKKYSEHPNVANSLIRKMLNAIEKQKDLRLKKLRARRRRKINKGEKISEDNKVNLCRTAKELLSAIEMEEELIELAITNPQAADSLCKHFESTIALRTPNTDPERVRTLETKISKLSRSVLKAIKPASPPQPH